MDQETSGPRAGSLLVVALSLGALADLLLYKQGLGFGWSLFLLALPAALLLLLKHNQIKAAPATLVPLLTAYAFFAIQLSVRDSAFVLGLNVVACLFLLGLLARLALPGQLLELRLGTLLSGPFLLLSNTLWRAGAPVAEVLSALQKVETRRSAGPLVRGLLLSLPVLLVLVPLLASADAVFGKYVGELGKLLQPERWAEQGGRLLLVLLTTWLVAGGLLAALTAKLVQKPARTDEERPLGFVEGMTVLSSVALVFGAFLAVQFTYLFGGAARVLAVPGLTYAQYARRGFFELVAVAVLTLALVLGMQALTRRTQAAHSRGFAGLASLIVAQTLILLGSAWQRMAAYEAAYGATPTRFHVDTFILWLGAALLWLGVTLWSRHWSTRFAIGGLACALGFVASLDLLNPDAQVARHNIARWEATGKLDVDAFYLLSSDANHELERLEQKLPAGRTRAVVEEIRYRRTRPGSWQSWRYNDL